MHTICYSLWGREAPKNDMIPVWDTHICFHPQKQHWQDCGRYLIFIFFLNFTMQFNVTGTNYSVDYSFGG